MGSVSQQSQIASDTVTVRVTYTEVGKCHYEQEIKAQDVSMHIKTMAVDLHTLSQHFMVRAPNHSSLFPAPSGEEVERGEGGLQSW